MGYDPVRGIATYGSGCMPGCTRQFNWWRANYGAGSLGCYNPASKAGGGPSLHAEGRAMDIALNANDPAQRARGDAIFDRVMRHPEQFGAQEMLWRGYIWSWNRRGEGKRGPGVQQAAHMNHVHLGIDVNAGRNWNESWVSGPSPEEDDLPDEATFKKWVADVMRWEVFADQEFKNAIAHEAQRGVKLGLGGTEEQSLQEVFDEAVKRAITGK